MKRTLGIQDFQSIEDKVERFRTRLLNDAHETLFLAKHYGIHKAVDAVFNQYKGQAIPLPALTAMAIQHMGNVVAADYKKVSAAIFDYLRLPSNRTWLSIRSGRDGGVRRIKDIPKRKR